MIKVENVEVWGFDSAIRGMRNPLNSWSKSDSSYMSWKGEEPDYVIGDNDLSLMRRLFKGGSEHRKYLRMIHVVMDITAPLYWVAELDTYKVGTSRNSCSFMHKGVAKPFELGDFSTHAEAPDEEWSEIINCLNKLRDKYLKTKDQKIFQQIRCLLPCGYNIRFTYDMNYENVFNMIRQREGHRLEEWHTFLEVLESLPYVKEICCE